MYFSLSSEIQFLPGLCLIGSKYSALLPSVLNTSWTDRVENCLKPFGIHLLSVECQVRNKNWQLAVDFTVMQQDLWGWICSFSSWLQLSLHVLPVMSIHATARHWSCQISRAYWNNFIWKWTVSSGLNNQTEQHTKCLTCTGSLRQSLTRENIWNSSDSI